MGASLVVIYALVDPRTSRVRYVGKARDPARRYEQHIRDGIQKRRDRKSRWIAVLLALGLRPSLIELERVPEAAWPERERWWIATFRATDSDLTNHQDGGPAPGPFAASGRPARRASARSRRLPVSPSTARAGFEQLAAAALAASGWRAPGGTSGDQETTRRR